MELTIIIPYYNGQRYIDKLVKSIPEGIPVIVVDDQSTVPYQPKNNSTLRLHQMPTKGYFTGAVNAGITATNTDVLVLNQDTWLEGDAWLNLLADKSSQYGMIGESISGVHPAHPNSYIQGTFMYIRRDVIDKVGLMNEVDYPLWGSTCEYQIRACRAGFKVLPMLPIPGFNHRRAGGVGEAIREVLGREPEKRHKFLRTPPEISVIATYYNNGRYAPELIASFMGGDTSLGHFEQQSFASFEIILVNDASTDNSHEILSQLADSWKCIRYVRRDKNGGSAAANNTGIAQAYGKYITILGGDDMRAAGSLERVYRTQLKNPHSFIYDNPLCFANGQYKPDERIGVSDYDFDKLIYRNHVHAGITFPKKAWEEVGGYPEVFGDGREDWAMNVALGRSGYCGVRINEVGYLYRREGQNRSLTNNTKEWYQRYYARLVALFPDLYGKGERPKMCCGSKNTNLVGQGAVSKPRPLLEIANMENLVIVEYVGKSYGTQSFYGVTTGTRYVAGLTRPRVAVDKNDLYGSQSRPGLLDMREGGKNIFRLVPPPKVVKVEAKPEVDVVEVETKPEPTVIGLGAAKVTAEPHVLTEADAKADLAGKPRPKPRATGKKGTKKSA